MKKAFPIMLMVIGLAFLAGGAYTITQGVGARNEVRSELVRQDIVTTPDASIPNVKVHDIATAQSMADIIDHHVREATGGRTYAELGRYLAKDGTDTSDPKLAVLDANGQPVPNPIRTVAFQGSALRTSLYTSIMAFKVAQLVTGLGLMILVLGFAVGGVGVALGGLVIPAIARRAHVETVTAKAV